MPTKVCVEILDGINVMIGYGFDTFWKFRVKR